MPEPSPSGPVGRMLHGWGRTAPVHCEVTRFDGSALGQQVRGAGPRGVLARGLGRSYGDAAQNSGGLVLLPGGAQIAVDETERTVSVSGGVSLLDLMGVLLPRGLFVPVTPGTGHVTVAGAIASDVHGKNHSRHGSFADHVVSFDLVGADGVDRRVTPDGEPDLFWATCGGMGLTGVITGAVLRLRPVETAYLTVTTERVSSFAALLPRLRETTRTREYAAAWVDLTARNDALGRSVLGVADHAPRLALSGAAAADPLAFAGRPRLRVPVAPPVSMVGRASVRAFNEVWFRKAPADRRDTVEHLSGFFHPLDAIADWNRLYGPRGLVQYQFVVPDGAEDALAEAVARISASRTAPFLGVLKRLGPSNRGWLSFPLAGWTLAADFPASPRLVGLFRDLDSLVLRAGGRVYLAKDAWCGPEAVHQMYPRASEFRDWRASTGAADVFVSDLSRRLDL